MPNSTLKPILTPIPVQTRATVTAKKQHELYLESLNKLEASHGRVLDRLVIYVSNTENLNTRLSSLEIKVETFKYAKRIKSLKIFASGFFAGQLLLAILVFGFGLTWYSSTH